MTTAPAASRPAVSRGGGGPRWRAARWVVLALALAAVAAFALAGRTHAPYDRLVTALAEGRVHEVQVVGAMVGDGGLVHDEQGVAVVQLRWREGPLSYVTEVTQATSEEELQRQAGTGPRPEPHVIGRADAPLREVAPGVRLTWTGEYGGTTVSVWRWELQGPWTWLPLVAGVATLLLVAGGPEPRWATRAGWAWLLMTPLQLPVLAAYLVASARPAHRPTARPADLDRRRLSGWWTFWLSTLITSQLRP